jgi:hypothetical protein
LAASGLIQAGTRITASLLASIAPLAVIKGADEPVTSSTTLQNDNALLLRSLVASATYLFACYLDYEGGTQGASDIKWTWSTPGSATLRYQKECVNLSGTAVCPTCTGSGTQTAGSNGAGTLMGVTMTGSLVMSSTGGTLQLQWAQNTSSATPTIVHAQSYLSLWRVT